MSFHTGRSVSNNISHGGFRPELFTVAGGSYASNLVYGSGAAMLSSYEPQTVRSMSRSDIRQQDNDVDFSFNVTLDMSLADPGFPATEELRLRTLQPLGASTPGAYLKKLPIKNTNHRQQLFLDVEIINATPGAAGAGFPFAAFPVVAGVGQFQARLLTNGELALVVYDPATVAASATTPLTAGDLPAALFGAAAGTVLQISIRGSYRSDI